MKKLEITIPTLPYAVEEAMNQLQISIKFCGRNTRKILISSSLPGEGKSVISVYLWKMLAEAGYPVVLVDLNLRHSDAKERWRMQSEEELTGIDSYLSGFVGYEDVLYSTNVKNGYVVPVSHLLENPSPLLKDEKLKELLDRLAREYRYVIVDTPPLEAVSDAALIACLCDGAVLVVRSGQTSKKLIRHSMEQLKIARCRFLGFVLNRVDTGTHVNRENLDDIGRDFGVQKKDWKGIGGKIRFLRKNLR